MAKISGKTFDHRETLKSYGAKWDGNGRFWTIADASADAIRSLNLPGVIVTPSENTEPTEQKFNADDDTEVNGRVGVMFSEPPVTEVVGPTTFIGNDRKYFGKMNRKNPRVFAGFASFNDMIEYVEKIDTRGWSGHRTDGWSSQYGNDWYGSDNMSHAIRLARGGWSEGIRIAQRALEIIESEHVTVRKAKYAVAGGRVNVGRMLAGQPMHMKLRTRQPGKKVVTLFVQTWMAALINAEQAAIRAASIAAMSDLLEHSGYSTEIVAVGTNFVNGCSCQIAITLKHAGDPLNLADIVFACGHPSMLRRFYFALAAVSPNMSQFWDSMGYQEAAFDPDQMDPNEFYLAKLKTNVPNGSLTSQIRAIFPLVVPPKFPIDLTS